MQLQPQADSEITLDLNPLDLQKNVISIWQEFSQREQFFKKLLSFLLNLTNARATVHLHKKGKKFAVNEYLLTADITKKGEELLLASCQLADQACSLGHSLVESVSDEENIWYLLVSPILENPQSTQAVALILELEEGDAPEPFLVLLQLVCASLPLLGVKERAQEQIKVAKQTSMFIELIGMALGEKELSRSAYVVATELQQYMGCSEVAIAVSSHWHCRMVAISGSMNFDSRSIIVKSMETAMLETIRSQKVTIVPVFKENRYGIQVETAHRDLLQLTKGSRVITHPLRDNKENIIGCWLFLWNQEPAGSQDDFYLIEAGSPQIGNLLHLLKTYRPSWLKRFQRQFFVSLGKSKVIFSLLFLLGLVFLSHLPFPYEIEAPGELTPEIRYIIGTPFTGVLQEVHVEPGDLVEKGQILARLDDREIRLELSSLLESLASVRKQVDLFFAQEEIAEYQKTVLESRKIEEKIKLLEYHLGNLEIKSPDTGIVLIGDLKKSLGSPVKLGDPLFEIAPLEKLLLEIFVPEEEIPFLKVGMSGELRINSYPEETWPIILKSISPLAVLKENQATFSAKAFFLNAGQRFLPGMKGKVLLEAEKRPLWWIYFHKPINWLRGKLWW